MKRVFFHILALAMMSMTMAKPSQKKASKNVEILEKDGSYIIKNRDSKGNPFLTGDIYLANRIPYVGQYSEIKLLVLGLTDDDESKLILETSLYREDNNDADLLIYLYKEASGSKHQKYTPNIELSAFKEIYFVTTNGKITKAETSIKDGNFYLKIKDFDFQNLSAVMKKVNDDVKAEKEAKDKEDNAKLSQFCTSVIADGEKLYKEKVLPVKDRSIPIFVSYQDCTMDYASGIDVDITFENVYDKTIKYTYFELTPYNRVNDITYSTIDHESTKVIRTVDFIEPNEIYKAHWRAVWYNNSIKYFKINSVKVMFTDNTSLSVPQKNIEKIFYTKDLHLDLADYNNMKLSLQYLISDNKFLIHVAQKDGKAYSSAPIEFYFDTDEYVINGISQKSVSVTFGSFFIDGKNVNREWDYSLDDVLLASAKNGYYFLKDNQNEEKIPFTEKELQFIRECSCMRYYKTVHP